MVRISSRKVDEAVWQKIHERFAHTLLSLEDNNAGAKYLSELLTPTEHAMLAKRLAIIVMLLEERSHYSISTLLKVSISTVTATHKKLDTGAYVSIEKILCHKKEREAFWDGIEVLLRGGMPAYGKGRWDAVNKLKNRS